MARDLVAICTSNGFLVTKSDVGGDGRCRPSLGRVGTAAVESMSRVRSAHLPSFILLDRGPSTAMTQWLKQLTD
jgi:hypothetical protein